MILKKNSVLQHLPPCVLFEVGQLNAYHLSHKIFTSYISIIAGSCCCYILEKRKILLKTEDQFTITVKYLVLATAMNSGKYLNKKPEELRCAYAIISEALHQKDFGKATA
jgi:hypothetical protein